MPSGLKTNPTRVPLRGCIDPWSTRRIGMGRKLSIFTQGAFDAFDCDPLQGGCGAKKGERCVTKTGHTIAYPHSARAREYNELQREKTRKEVIKRGSKEDQITNETKCLVVKGGCGAPQGERCVSRSGTRVTGGFHLVREKLWEGGIEAVDDVPVEKQKPYWPLGDPYREAPKARVTSNATGPDSTPSTLPPVLTQRETREASGRTRGQRIETLEGSLRLLLSLESVDWLIHRMAVTLVEVGWDLAVDKTK
jgi:hypothetical protein